MPKTTKSGKVFISHGHNEIVKLKLKEFLGERLGLEPVILVDQPDEGLTVVEKLEKYGPECDFALIVLTTDDQTTDGGRRARQNVIHELGYFHGILGRDKVLLLKQSGVDLFSNISGLVYKEFDREKIELVFEDIRKALDGASAQKGGVMVPSEKATDMSSLLSESLDTIAHKWPQIEKDHIKKGLQEVIRGLSVDLHIRRIKKFLEDEKKQYGIRLVERQTEAERSKQTFNADPEHGGKMAAMTLAIFASIAPQTAIDLIDKLLGEVSFLEAETVSPDIILGRLISICDSESKDQ